MSNIQLVENLYRLRKAHHYTQQEISDLLNISRQAYSNYETSKRTPDLDSLMRLADIYGVQLVVRSSMNREEGTVVKEVVKVEKLLISGVASDKNTARISVIGIEENREQRSRSSIHLQRRISMWTSFFSL